MPPSKPDKATLIKKEIKTPKTENSFSGEKPKVDNIPPKKGCCMGTSECPQPAVNQPAKLTTTHSALEEQVIRSQKGPKTRIIIKYDVGFNNLITIRGKGAGLNWDRGLSLKNIDADEWVWETDAPFTASEFKVLINDAHYELGENHILRCGSSIQYTPKFF
jgi:hypothetical protein